MEEVSDLQNGNMIEVRRGNSTWNERLFCTVNSYSTEIITFAPLRGRHLMTYASNNMYSSCDKIETTLNLREKISVVKISHLQ